MNDTEELVSDYLEIRKLRESLKARYEAEDEQFKECYGGD